VTILSRSLRFNASRGCQGASRYATIVDPRTVQETVIPDRSSDGTFFMLNENPFIARLGRRVAEAMQWPIENGEACKSCITV
jgi:hypothetical protein